MRLVGDIECDGLLYDASVIHCMVNYDIDNNYWYISHTGDHDIKIPENATLLSFLKHRQLLESADELIYHNGMGYDFPVMEKLLRLPIDTMMDKFTDTYIMSSLFYPDRQWGHSLAGWGRIMNFHKGDFHEFEKFSQEMLDYCLQDVRVTRRIYDELLWEMEQGYQGGTRNRTGSSKARA